MAGVDGAPHSVAGEAWRRMRALAYDAGTVAHLRQQFEAMGLTLGVAKALVHLSPSEPNAMRQLAGALHCDNSYVTSVADVLEERGLVRREAHPTDRRIKVLVLTPEGVATREKIDAALSTPPEFFGALDPEEVSQLNTLLDKLDPARRLSRAASGGVSS